MVHTQWANLASFQSSTDAVEVEGMVANACTKKKKKKPQNKTNKQTIFVNKKILLLKKPRNILTNQFSH